MDHPDAFDKLVGAIALDPSREDRIRKETEKLRLFVRGSDLGALASGDLYVQGSWAYGTVARPVKPESEYDVDLVLPVDAGRLPPVDRNPRGLVRRLSSSLELNPAYRGKTSIRNACVRIHFPPDFHLDVVPADQPRGVSSPGRVPHQARNEWRPTNPRGYADWVRAVDKGSQGRFVKTVTMLKRWRERTFAPGRGPRSIVLTTLAGQASPLTRDAHDLPIVARAWAHPSLAAYFADTVEIMAAELRDPMRKVLNPIDASEEITRDWPEEDRHLFARRLEELKATVCAAYAETDARRSFDLWREAFPVDFPGHP